MTAVLFKFSHPDGTPVADAPFLVTTRKPSFDETLRNGIQVPGDVAGVTDAQGEATLELMAGFATYYLLMDNPGAVPSEDGCTAGLRYRFVVTESDVPLRVEDLIVTTPTFSRPWDETALQIIIDAKTSSQASATHAKASEVAAAGSATQAGLHEQAASGFADASEASSVASANSATAAGLSQVAAKLSEDNSKLSENASRASELSAAASADFAASVITDAQAQVDEATRQAGLAGDARDAAELSATHASDSAAATAADVLTTAANVQTTQTNKLATAADVQAVTTLKGETSDLKDQAGIARDEAVAAAQQASGAFTDGGLVNLSTGAYPAKPSVSTIWRVSVGGTVTSTPEGTIKYVAGDNLVYSKTANVFYKTDNSQTVTSVAGRIGDVVVTAADVGLPNVNNTADMDKPVSNAQRTEFNARTVTTSNLDTTANRLVKVGDYGENGGVPISRIVTDDANALSVAGTYAFTNGGVNVPEAAYIKHITGTATGYAKQLAYGILTDKQYVRTQKAGVWTAWTSSVEIVDALNSTDPNKALSAKQGKVLYDLLQANNVTAVRYTYNLTAGQTAITGADLAGKTLVYTPGALLMVELNGFPIWIANDYTASNGSLITLLQGVEAASEVAVTVFGSFSVADHYTKAEDDALLAVKASAATVATIQSTYNKLTLDITQIATSGVNKDFVIPSNAKRVTLFFNGLSGSGSAAIIAQLGAGSVQSTGYVCANTVILNSSSTVTQGSTGVIFGGTAGANTVYGSITFTHMGNNTWVCTGTVNYSNVAATGFICGAVTLTGTLDRLRVTTANGTDTFDAGAVNVLVEV
jgi:hypothetical protein